MALIRAGDWGTLVHQAHRRLWSNEGLLGLRCDLANLPAPCPAKVPVRMEPQQCPGFRGFDREYPTGSDWCSAGVSTLYVASDEQRQPIFAVWLIHSNEFPALRAACNAFWHPPGRGEVELEGGYAFEAFRGLGAMADGLHQVLQTARAEGASSAVAYVSAGNVPSLRGAARVGFKLDHLMLFKRRLGIRFKRLAPVDHNSRMAWLAAGLPSPPVE
jgi:RimJ/RimL family protein N-acetyltransferase